MNTHTPKKGMKTRRAFYLPKVGGSGVRAMLNLFSGTPVAAASTQQKHKRKNDITSGSSGTAATVSASTALSAGPGSDSLTGPQVARSAHAFNAPEAEQVLGLRRLLVKIVGAKDLPGGTGARRSCSAEVQLIDERGVPLSGGAGKALHAHTGPPNHFTTVKDTAPVWNAEFVAELRTDLLAAAAVLRFDVWDDAVSPPLHLGEARLYAGELQRLCMREEERSLPLERSAPSTAGALPAPDGAAGVLRVRLSYVDVRTAMGLLGHAESVVKEAQAAAEENRQAQLTLETQVKIMGAAAREEEERATFFRTERRSAGPLNSQAASAAKVTPNPTLTLNL